MNELKVYIQENTNSSTILSRIKNSVPLVQTIKDRQAMEKVSLCKENADDIIIYAEDGCGCLVEKCPGTMFSLCCNYYVIKNIINCPMRCSYCYLQTFVNNNYITIHTNADIVIKQLEGLLERKGRLRVGTGEYSDSMVLENITGWTELLTDFGQNKKNLQIEFKTKYTHIGPYHNSAGNIIYGVTLEPESVRKKEQKHTSSIAERINYLEKAVDNNNKVAIHFDPVIYSENIKEEYENLIFDLSRHIKERSIEYISMGCMRFSKGLVNHLLSKHLKTDILKGEFVLCPDMKYRYPREMRVFIFRLLSDMLRKFYKAVPLYLCMEDKITWDLVFKEHSSNCCHIYE